MNRIENLLQGQKVEWRTLGEVAELKRGRVISKTYLTENIGDFPVYSSQTMNNGEIGKIDTFDFEGDYLTWTTDGAYAGTIFKRKGKFSITNVCGLIDVNKDVLNLDFLFHWLSITTKKYVYSGMGNPKLMSNQIAKIPIPLPPLAVQKEIANILDTFTKLEAELEAELDCRKRQYHHYRDTLLTFGNEVEWKTLGEVCGFRNGFAFQSKKFQDEGEPILRIGNIQNQSIQLDDLKYFNKKDYKQNLKPFEIKNGDILIAMSGATTGKVGILKSEKTFYLNQRVGKFEPFEGVLHSRYLYHYLLSKTNDLYILAGGGAQPNLSSTMIMEKIKIPLPSLEEQRRIVNILDKFDTLTNSITEGLPKEIELRRKQYEYYREKLLSFNKD
ncbi:restriction endonuclease subunit S [Bergeyella zoohelcum]|uniref:Type I restriction modification DNA specificity domain-containing protein n=1 Tax=Bergeyella zoohelcum ATCC 43767 TaxID=883096 RepID=K1LTG7_9FLAO|nr:restriction endonuclease subunit S [Bergeyella zoohelcum]EKB55407.1 hypothetical protein HMPREF9699_01721 [Bergeyella zoohelcum ATCC 43767]SUV50200.1 Type I restriction enzyme specificity protein MPN_089 [Bergeyella zoohelcum]